MPLCVLALAAAVVAGWLGYREHQGSQIDAAREDAIAPAGRATEALLSYRYDTLDQELAEESDLMTDSYSDEYLLTFAEKAKDVLAKQRATMETTVLAAAAMECGDDCSPDAVNVLVYLNSEESAEGKPPEVAPNRAVLTMRDVDGGWKVDGIDLF